MSNRFSYPCDETDVVINGFFDVMTVVAVAMLIDVNTIVADSAVIALEFNVAVLYGLDVMGDMRSDVSIVIVTDIGVDLLADVMTALEFVIAEPFKEFGC